MKFSSNEVTIRRRLKELTSELKIKTKNKNNKGHRIVELSVADGEKKIVEGRRKLVQIICLLN